MFHISLKNTSGWVLLMQQNSKNSKLKTEKKKQKTKKKKPQKPSTAAVDPRHLKVEVAG